MRRLRDRVAGLDVHRDSVTACVKVFAAEEELVTKEKFSTTTAGVAKLADWLAEREVTTVAMEATGVYWKPVYYGLEGRFEELWLCNPQHVKNVPGRKTDMADAEWLADVVAHGMVRPSLVPEEPIRAVRELTRYRKTQIDMRAREIQRLDKLLQDAGIKLSSVTSHIWSVSSRAMVHALIEGESDPVLLAELAKGRMRKKIPALEQALRGRFANQHAVVARQILAHIDFLDTTIARLDEAIQDQLRPFDPHIELLVTIVGWQRRTAEVFLVETGADMTRFPSAAHLASWTRMCPANHESAGKHKPVGKKPGKTWLGGALIEASRSASRSKGTHFSAKYSRIARRRGPNKAAVAVAHAMVIAAWNILTTGEPYHDPGPEWFDRFNNPTRETDRLLRRLQALGYQVTLTPAA